MKANQKAERNPDATKFVERAVEQRRKDRDERRNGRSC